MINCHGNRDSSILIHLDSSALTSGISFVISKGRKSGLGKKGIYPAKEISQ